MPKLIANDPDISGDDVDLLEEHILSQKKKCRAALAEMEEKGKQVAEDVDDERELKTVESDEELVNYNFHTFSIEDLTNPTFNLG